MSGVIVIIILAVILAFFIMIAWKNEITYRNRDKIIDAVRKYRCYLIATRKMYDGTRKVDYTDMENYYRTLWRLWDWGYKRILPKDMFEIIKPYMEKDEKGPKL